MNVERRRSDPASRILCRVRTRCRRAGIPVTLKVKEFRKLLGAEDQRYVDGDKLSCCRIRDDGPLSADNVRITRVGRLDDDSDDDDA